MIPEQKVKVRWSSNNKEYYISKGYPFTKYRETFYIDVNDLQKKSNVYIRFICDYCNGENQIDEKSKYTKFSNLNNQKKFNSKDCCNHKECMAKKLSETKLSKSIPKGESFAEKYPDLAKEWNYSKNEKTPYDYKAKSNITVWWKCTKGHEWNVSPNNRALGKGCPYCAGSLPSKDYNILVVNPNLCLEWDYIKNTKPPTEYTPNTHTKVWWKCINNHSWKASISNRNKGRGCPYCSGKLACEDNCLATTNHQIAKEWNYEKNDTTPFVVTKSSNKVVWWKCEEKGHEWKTSVAHRTSGQGCPYCSGHKVCLDNCLANVDPILSQEWNYNKNGDLTPNDVTKGSNKNVWWICSECAFEWKSKVNNRFHGNGCPQCSESKGEKKIRIILENLEIPFESQYIFNDLLSDIGKPLRFDFVIYNDNSKNSVKLLIEYDGIFHFDKIYNDDGHEKIVKHDKRKNNYCKKHNIKLLRIPYWEFNNIEDILNKELNT